MAGKGRVGAVLQEALPWLGPGQLLHAGPLPPPTALRPRPLKETPPAAPAPALTDGPGSA